jgi:hypothetical protein
MVMQDMLAGHISMVASGALPSGTGGKGKFSLVGCDGSVLTKIGVSDYLGVRGLRMSEVLEWTACRRAARKGSAPDSGGGGGLSIGNLFGMNSGDKSAPPTKPLGDRGEPPSATDSAALQEKALRVRVALCFPKLKFAMLLAELGLLEGAAAYVFETKSVVELCKKTGMKCNLRQYIALYTNSMYALLEQRRRRNQVAREPRLLEIAG